MNLCLRMDPSSADLTEHRTFGCICHSHDILVNVSVLSRCLEIIAPAFIGEKGGGQKKESHVAPLLLHTS